MITYTTKFGLYRTLPVLKQYKLYEWDRQLSSTETIQHCSICQVKQIKSKTSLWFKNILLKLILLWKSVIVWSRYDYDNVDIDAACEMMENLEMMIADKSFVKQRFAVEDKIYQVEKADNFEYTDPVDSTIYKNQVYIELYLCNDMVDMCTDVGCTQWLSASEPECKTLPCPVLGFFHCRVWG